MKKLNTFYFLFQSLNFKFFMTAFLEQVLKILFSSGCLKFPTIKATIKALLLIAYNFARYQATS